MRKLLKKVLALSLCACMMIGMATGASAAETPSVFASRNILYITKNTVKPIYLNENGIQVVDDLKK